MPFLGNRKTNSTSAGTKSIVVSAMTIVHSAAVSTTIGALSVKGGSGSYTYTIPTNPGGLFQISGSNLQVGASLASAAGHHQIVIQAVGPTGIVLQPVTIIVF